MRFWKKRLRLSRYITCLLYTSSDYVGGLKEATLREKLAKKPEQVIELAVKGMLPKGPLGRHQGMAPVRQVTIGPMFVGRKLEEIGWESVPMNDPRITAHPDWLEHLQKRAGRNSQSFEI